MLAAFCAALVAVGEARAQDEAHDHQTSAGEARGAIAEAPVEFRAERLFVVRAPIGDLTLEARAQAIEERLLAIASGPTEVLGEIRVEPHVASHDVLAGDRLVTSVLDADALPTGRTRAQLAADYTLVVRRALEREFRSRSAQGLALGAAQALAATVLFALAVAAVSWAMRRSSGAILAHAGTRIRDLRMRGFTFLTADRFAGLLRSLVRILSFVVVAVLLSLYLEAVFSYFPWTRGLADQLRAFARGLVAWLGSGIWQYLPNVFYIAAIVVAARLGLRALRFLFGEIERGAISLPGFFPEWATTTYKIIRVIALAFTLVVLFPYLPGSDSPAFRGVSVFFGLLFSIGSASAVGNAVAGIVITYMRPFREGDRVRIADTVGDVIEKDLLVVRIRTIKNVEITIPNSMVLANHIVNYSREAEGDGLILNTEVTIGYDAPWRRVHELLIAAARGVDGILPEPAPFVLQTKLNDFYVHYELNAVTNRPNEMAELYARLHERIQDEFARGGIEIMSPHYAAARDGNAMALPPEHLPRGYEPPPFRVASVTGEKQG